MTNQEIAALIHNAGRKAIASQSPTDVSDLLASWLEDGAAIASPAIVRERLEALQAILTAALENRD